MKVIDAARRAQGFDPVQDHPRWHRRRLRRWRAWPTYLWRLWRWRRRSVEWRGWLTR